MMSKQGHETGQIFIVGLVVVALAHAICGGIRGCQQSNTQQCLTALAALENAKTTEQVVVAQGAIEDVCNLHR